MGIQNLRDNFFKSCPWGPLFSKKSNFNYGYLKEEGSLVDKYFKKRDQVLIIGSGNGREARPICFLSGKVICIDIGNLYLKVGQQLCCQEKLSNIYFIQADMFDLPFSNNKFDFVFFSLYSYCNEKRFEMLLEINRIMRGDGLLLLTAETPEYRKIRDAGNYAIIENEHILRREVNLYGFEMIEALKGTEWSEYLFSILKKK